MTSRVKLIVDSTADLPPDWYARWDIQVLPVFINFGEESLLDDGVSISHSEFYRRLKESAVLPKTSAPAPGMAQALIEKQLAKADQVVFFTVASQFSGIYNSVKVAAQDFDPRRVTVVDSGQVSMALGWMMVAAAEAAERGAGPEEIVAAAMSSKSRTRLVAVIDTLEYLRRSGRVNYFVAGIGTLLQIKPIIEVINGQVIAVQRARTMTKGLQGIVELTRNEAPLERLALLHTNNPDLANDLKARLQDVLPADTITGDITTAIGVHIGPNCAGVALVRKG